MVARLLCVALIGTQACFLPVPFSESGSPPLAGILFRSDGIPAAGRRIAVSTHYDDSTCSRARASATTDSGGRFALPRTIIRRRGILLFPAFERFANGFTLCSGAGGDTVLHSIYEGSVPLSPTAPAQTVHCYEWVLSNADRITCSTRDESKVVDGGVWATDSSRGWYRLILTQELALAPGYRRPVPRPHAYVLWIEEAPPGAPYRVRETVRLPIDGKVTALSHVELLERNGRFYANFPGYKRAFMNDFASAELRFELDAPGQVTKVAGP